MVFQHLMILALTQVSLAKVSPNFDDCREQFYASTPPSGFPDTMTSICQMFENCNNPLFASLYSTSYRRPLYSAYILDKRASATTGVSPTFRVEPQLVDIRLPPQMMKQSDTETAICELEIKGDPTDLIKEKQAINSDYEGSKYHRGHLNPNAHHPSGPAQTATYTLTNVAPMFPSLNSGKWRVYEAKVRKIANTCGKMYVVTGVVPGNNWISVNGVQRVNIPSYIWSGYCCLDNKNQPIIAGGALAPNYINLIEEMSIDNLQTELNGLLDTTITLFQNNCS
ncbi:endonuclease domain-containing 1 protein-like [Mantella aurantiaca]